MAENNLFQLAQVVTDLPMHHHQAEQHQPSSPMPNSHFGNNNTQQQQQQQQQGRHPLAARKNACIVCTVCFTCSGNYGTDCLCAETQPRRGKNLPHRALDSRAKKLNPADRDDYEFTLKWLDEYAHDIYRDSDKQIIGLSDLTEVSLCKAHSSTLYRAKKKHQGNMNQAPPSPADSNGTMMEDTKQHRSSSVDSHPLLPQPINHHHYNSSNYNVGGGALAAKVREISFQQPHYRLHDPPESPDFSMMTASTSVKRKRTSAKLEVDRPSSSASTPLYASGGGNSSNNTPSIMNHRHSNLHLHHQQQQQQQQSSSSSRQPTGSFSSQLPPLHLRQPSLSSLSSTLQHQLHVTPDTFNNNMNPNTAATTNNNNNTRHQTLPVFHHLPQHKVIETVSLKCTPVKEDNKEVYYIRNLAITDNYTFQDLLSEIDFAGPPPPGKRVVISDSKRERIFPLAQAIRNVIRYPTDTHIEFYLGLTEKASIDWSNYK